MRGTIRTFGPAAVSGVLLATCFPRFQLFYLAWFALVPLLWRARSLSPLQTALHFFVAGFVFHAILLQWLLSNIMWAGGWAVIGQQLLCVILGLYWAAAGWLWRWLGTRNTWLGGPISFALIWTAMEHTQATLFTGFGWSSLAYSQGPDLYFLQWAALGTGLAVSFLIALVNALLVHSIVAPPSRALSVAAALAVIAAAHAVGFLLLKPSTVTAEPLKVGLFQSNYSLEMKWDPEYRIEAIRNASEKSISLSRQRDLDLMIWPEALILADVNTPDVNDLLTRTTREGRFSLFAGAGRLDGKKDYNSALLMNEAGTITAWYDKIHLAPFGEYVPLSSYLPFVSKMVPTVGDLSAGSVPRVMKVNGRALGPLICFEVLFSPMSNRLRREGADFLVVATNLAWFGRSTAIPQELEIARVRAVESRLPLVHAANTGIAGVFDPYGRFTPVNFWAAGGERILPLRDGLPLDALVMQRLVGAFDLPAAEPQPFLEAQRYIPWIADALCALLVLLAFALPRRTAAP